MVEREETAADPLLARPIYPSQFLCRVSDDRLTKTKGESSSSGSSSREAVHPNEPSLLPSPPPGPKISTVSVSSNSYQIERE